MVPILRSVKKYRWHVNPLIAARKQDGKEKKPELHILRIP
jgi:hypothetical protein